MGTHRVGKEALSERIMTMSSNEQVVFRDYPLKLWLMGVIAVVGTWVPNPIMVRLLFALLGVAAIGFMSVLTVAVDHTRGTLNLHYRALFRRSTKVYSVNDVCLVNVVEDRGEGTYRLELALRSGEVVPLRFGYTSGKEGKERRAQRLRSALRVGGVSTRGSHIRITISKS
jgi:hypothetical protein